MRKRLSRLRSDDLIRDSFLMFAAGMVFNVFSYGYHFYVGRALRRICHCFLSEHVLEKD